MRSRPIRSRIYLPIVRCGLIASDWKYVALATLMGYFVPYFLNVRIMRVPLFFFTGVGVLFASYIFFYFIRVGRRPRWFEHTMRAAVESGTRRRLLPSDAAHRHRRSWILQSD